jgi:hypothetical protein
MDLTSALDINLASTRAIYEASVTRPLPPAVTDPERRWPGGTLRSKDRLGLRDLRHPTAGEARPRPQVPARRRHPRLRHGQRHGSGSSLGIVNEAYRALGDEVATEADIDTALKLGAGHPLAGPFEAGQRGSVDGGARVGAHAPDAAYGPAFEPAPLLLQGHLARIAPPETAGASVA